MKISHLACRVYRLEPRLEREVKSLLLNSKKDRPLHYDTYPVPDGEDIDLSIVIKERHKNTYGQEVSFWVDQVTKLPDREERERPIRYYKEYQIQVFDGTKNFNNCLIIFGPKEVDSNLMKAIKNYLRKGDERVADPFILIRPDFKTIEVLMQEFPNLQHFCIKNIPDERTKGVIVRGNNLEETDLFERFVIDKDTKGPINFLGITTEFGKLVYLGMDGSIYSRMSFAKEDTVKIIYDLYSKLKKIKVLLEKGLENF